MAVTPNDLLEAARDLATGNREVDFRNAASRAYYAAYHRCKPIAKRFGLRSSARGVHSDVIDALNVVTKPAPKQLARLLRKSRTLRSKADYRTDQDLQRSEVETSIRHAEKIYAIADQFESTAASP